MIIYYISSRPGNELTRFHLTICTVCFGDLGRGTYGKRSIDQDSLYTENI